MLQRSGDSSYIFEIQKSKIIQPNYTWYKTTPSAIWINGLSIAPIANLIHRVPLFNLECLFCLSNCSCQSIYVFFFSHTINLWNNLPDSVVHSNSLVTFKHSLQLYVGCMLALAVHYFMHPLLNFIKKKKNTIYVLINSHSTINLRVPRNETNAKTNGSCAHNNCKFVHLSARLTIVY